MTILRIMIILWIIPFVLQGQRVVTLSLIQPPEFRFEAPTKEYSIVKGGNVALGSDLKIMGGTENYSFRWSPGTGLTDSTLKNPVASPQATTTYLLKVTDKNGCTFSLDYKVTVTPSSPAVLIPSGNGQLLSADIYPNPSDGRFMIRLKGKPSPEVSLLIVDGLGRILDVRKFDHFRGKLEENLRTGLPSGIYTLVIRSEVGSVQSRLIIFR